MLTRHLQTKWAIGVSGQLSIFIQIILMRTFSLLQLISEVEKRHLKNETPDSKNTRLMAEGYKSLN